MARAEALLQEGLLLKKECASLVDGSVANSAEHVTLKLELKNAFNTVDRSAFLCELSRVAPHLVPFVDGAYRDASHVRAGMTYCLYTRDWLSNALFEPLLMRWSWRSR
eukprot:373878-Amphidinium_carterae.1